MCGLTIGNVLRVWEKMMPHDPFLFWVGSKKWLVPELVKYYSSEYRLVEPFCGGLSISLGLLPKKALLNDVNDLLINLYSLVQSEDFFVAGFPDYPDQDAFFDARNEFNALKKKGIVTGRRIAELYFYLNITCHHGLYRLNSKGEFNTAYGYRKTLKKPNFKMYRNVFQEWEFRTGDFSEIEIKDGDFIYADPPYDVEHTDYYNNNFDWEQQVRLVDFLCVQDVPVVISNEATDRVVSLYKDRGFVVKYVTSPRKFAAQYKDKQAKEILAFRNLNIKSIPTLF